MKRISWLNVRVSKNLALFNKSLSHVILRVQIGSRATKKNLRLIGPHLHAPSGPGLNRVLAARGTKETELTFTFYIINPYIVYVFCLFFNAEFKKITSRVIGPTSFFLKFYHWSWLLTESRIIHPVRWPELIRFGQYKFLS